MTEQEKIRIHELVLKSLEGTIAPDECRQLESWIAADSVTRTKYYAKCVDVCIGLSKIQQIISDPIGMTSYLKEMAEYERTAESVPFQRQAFNEQPIPIQTADTVNHLSRPGRFPLYIAVVSMAALILMLLYVYFIPQPKSAVDVATLADSINAKWLDPASSVNAGERLWTNQGPVTLKEGIISIRYDDGVDVVVQAPAEYELLTPTEIAINYGRVCAKVSEAGWGFTVKTRNSRIIDLGTEFGVLADVQGDTQLHVFNGKTMLIAGAQKKDKKIIEVPAGRAMAVNGSETKDIELKKTAFARIINSQTGLVWNGEEAIDLASIIGGGDGLKSVRPGIDSTAQDLFGHPMLRPGEFMPIKGNRFVDGIFIPNGAQGPVPIVRDGSITWNAPVTEVRQKIGYIRYDISGLKGNFSNAVVSFNVSSWEGKKLVLSVYGLKDGDGDLWEESQVCYANAPGFGEAPLGQYKLYPNLLEKLGEIALDGLGVKESSVMNLGLDSFIAQDTNGLLTFALICESGDPGDDWKMTTKEGEMLLAPRLTLYDAAGRQTAEITTAVGRGADTYLSNDNQYASTGPGGCHGTEGVIKIRDYCKDPVYLSVSPGISYFENGILRTQLLTEEAEGNSILGMRAISGITIDLRKIRNYCPGQVSVKSFTASCGVAEITAKSPKVSFYVLVNGKERFSKMDMTSRDAACAIEVELDEQDSYLTLAVAHGTDRKSSRDWGFFVCPRLNIE